MDVCSGARRERLFLRWVAERPVADRATWTARAGELSIESDQVDMLTLSNLDHTRRPAPSNAWAPSRYTSNTRHHTAVSTIGR